MQLWKDNRSNLHLLLHLLFHDLFYFIFYFLGVDPITVGTSKAADVVSMEKLFHQLGEMLVIYLHFIIIFLHTYLISLSSFISSSLSFFISFFISSFLKSFSTFILFQYHFTSHRFNGNVHCIAGNWLIIDQLHTHRTLIKYIK